MSYSACDFMDDVLAILQPKPDPNDPIEIEDVEGWAIEACEEIKRLQETNRALLAALREYVERHEAEGASPGLPEYDQACAALAKAEGR